VFRPEQRGQVNVCGFGQEFRGVPEPSIDCRRMGNQPDPQSAQRREPLIAESLQACTYAGYSSHGKTSLRLYPWVRVPIQTVKMRVRIGILTHGSVISLVLPKQAFEAERGKPGGLLLDFIFGPAIVPDRISVAKLSRRRVMTRFTPGSTRGGWLLGAILLFGAGVAARAAEVEVRNFTTKIDGNPAGTYRMTITRQDDGSVSMVGQADVKVTKVGFTVYKYSYRGTEVWKDGRLVRFQSSTDDDGKKFTVTATAEGDGVRLKVNGEESSARADWLTSYWQLPTAEMRKRHIALIDVDNGKSMNGAIRYLGTEQVTVCGKPQNCAHYRVTGPNMVDVWYDAQERLVRQEWMDEGYHVRLELTSVRR
jgi:hypothetical protein